MARIKGGMNARRKHNKVLKLAKGYRGARSKQYRIAKQSVMRALASQFAGRKVARFNYSKTGAAAEYEIDALSGATITTNAMVSAVNAGLAYAESLGR